MITSHCFPETQFIAVTAYQNEEVRRGQSVGSCVCVCVCVCVCDECPLESKV